jgi:hypothetical protein
MQTYLPYADFELSASVLDNRRLGKQREVNLQIMQAVIGFRLQTRKRKRIDHKLRWVDVPEKEWKFVVADGAGWHNHPTVLMWKATPRALMAYQDAICDEWESRGFHDTCRHRTRLVLEKYRQPSTRIIMPKWFGDEDVHLAHRAELVRKDPLHYTPIFGRVPVMQMQYATKENK